jgi:DNA-directed RNA polymerase subunit RPC12/RpoP
MNYVLEDNFNFFEELNTDSDTIDEYNTTNNNNTNNNNTTDNTIDKCMISHMPLTYNYITLPCKHKFNYISLYNELIINYKNYSGIKCPYCREKYTKMLPYIPLPGVDKKSHGKVTNKSNYQCVSAPKCKYIITIGKNKGKLCDKDGLESEKGTFCLRHNNITLKKVKPSIIWTEEKEKLCKSKLVSELREMLKELGLKTTGTKKELVNRYIIHKN